MITATPLLLQRYSLGDLEQQALTGLSIATIDAAISTPLERAKIVSAFTGGAKVSLKTAYKDGWKGFATHWSKLAVNWVTFLTSQKYFRDQSGSSPESPLPFSQATKVGVQVALLVSLAAAPFDIANTLKQAKNVSPTHFFSHNSIAKFYRGFPLNALALIVHNIASVIVIDRLSKYE